MSEKREKPCWEGRHYSFFQNTECEYFPCHRIADPSRFNCLFCYCPLYMLGPRCGGNFTYNAKGIKVCTDCAIPHLPENYGRITGKYEEIAAVMRQTPPAFVPVQPSGSASDQPPASVPDQSPASVPDQPSAFASDQPSASASDQPSASVPDQLLSDSGSDTSGKNSGSGRTGISSSERGNRCTPAEAGRPFGRIVMMACTRRGFETMRRAAEALAELLPESEILQTGRCADVPGYEDGPGLSEVTGKWFGQADALIYFAAAGIAVRCIAPFVRDKFRDPAVLVSDENGRVMISLMSGHAGGANRLSLVLAEALGAQPVITTATDGRGLFAVDVFAAENGLHISDRTAAKMISARILAGEIPKIFFEDEYSGATDDCGQRVAFFNNNSQKTPVTEKETDRCTRAISAVSEKISRYGEGIQRTSDRSRADIVVSWRRSQQDREGALYLIPRAVTLGIGCRRGTPEEAVQKAVKQVLADSGIFRQAIMGIASIDLKKEEQGLLAFAGDWDLPLTFYSAEELNAVPGMFTASDFVLNVTGVDCVCERSAVRLASDCAAAGGESMPDGGNRAVLLVKKQSLEGVTAALALQLT